jgi:diaminopimelate decarboxylase
LTDLSLFPPSAQVEGDDLLIGGCSLRDIAARFGTPAYVIDEQSLRARAKEYVTAMTSRHARSRICFAVKAFPSVSMIRVLVSEGLGCDVVGGGELKLALTAGADPATVVMHGNAKTDADIQAALDARIGYIVVDGFDDIDRIERLATERTTVLLRVSPGIDAVTHEAMATGGTASKFGLPFAQVPDAIARMGRSTVIDLCGLHAHIGSQITVLNQFEAEVAALASVAPHQNFGVYNFGGGLGVRYEPGDQAPSIDDYADRLLTAAGQHLGDGGQLAGGRLASATEIIVEPGRSLVAPMGLTLYTVVTVKRTGRTHVAVDGGMGDNLEHSLYGQRFTPAVIGRWTEPPIIADLVGRHCESGDVITEDVPLNNPRIGDLVAVPVTGAYCFTMGNNYNAAPRPPVIYCADGRARLGVRRETVADLLSREVGLPLCP